MTKHAKGRVERDDDEKEIESLRSRWTQLYAKTLPSLARARDTAQKEWPVTLDHCFARIILDNTIGEAKTSWDQIISKPAVRTMTIEQLRRAIALGEDIERGDADLVLLDRKSLKTRGKNKRKYANLDDDEKATAKEPIAADDAAKKRKANDVNHDDNADNAYNKSVKQESTELTSPSTKKHKQKQQSILSFSQGQSSTTLQTSQPFELPANRKDANDIGSNNKYKGNKSTATLGERDPQISSSLHKIARNASLTPYRKRLYSTLLSVPMGSYTTYAAMASYLDSSARAVGNGMRNNPYAPEVPCHRVLAADGSIGGFGGAWGKDGMHATKKVDLLKDEGVTFDSRGKVKGPVFTQLRDLSKEVDARG